MDAIRIEVTGARQAGIRFDAFPDGLHADLLTEIRALGGELLVRVEADTPMATGLLRSEERLRVFDDPNRVTAYVDIQADKGSGEFARAGALEYGAHRATKVDAHSMRLDHHWSLMLSAPETVMVAAFTRTPNIQEFAFERGPLAAMAPEVFARLNAVVETATVKANA